MKIIPKLDKDQQSAVEQYKNAVVSAGAGSGKTRVLAQRFAYLVSEKKYRIDEILTLTFTKKATNEMYGRIYQTLRDIDPSFVNDFYQANIKTLDSYCAQIVRYAAHRYGIRPDFTQDDDEVTELVKKQALPFILKNKDNRALQLLIKTKNLSDIADELFTQPILSCSTLADPIDFNKLLKKQKLEVCCQWKNNTTLIHGVLRDLFVTFDATEANKNTKFGNAVTALKNRTWSDPPELTESILETADRNYLEPYLTELRDAFFSFSLPTGKAAAAWTETTSYIRKLRDLYGTITALANFAAGYGITASVIPLMDEFQRTIAEAKRNMGLLTFADCSSLAVRILAENPELRAVEKNKYKAIMIDEFQDTNGAQRDLLFMLAEKPELRTTGIPTVNELCPDKLFFVGDEKQSIYRFRGADVSVFRSLKNSFPEGNLELRTNYRSDPALIAGFNTLFGGTRYPPASSDADTPDSRQVPTLFVKDAESANKNANTIPPYEARYSSVLIPAEKEIKSFENGWKQQIHVALLKTKRSDEESENETELLTSNENEAFWVANKIASLIEGKDGSEPVKPGNIAILLRKYSIQPVFERALQNAGIPYNSEVIKGFFSDGPVNDIFSFLRLLAYPSDTLAYGTLLRSPFCGLTTPAVQMILSCQGELFSSDVVQILRTSHGEHSANQFVETGKMFHDTALLSQTASLTELITKLWYDLGYRYETMWNRKVSMYTSLYDQIFELARRSDEKSEGLTEFVDSMRTLAQQNSKLNNMDIPLEHGDDVHLLTIFRSKGLEYPVVFVCGIADRTLTERNQSAVFCSKTYGISLNTPPLPLLSKDKYAKKNYFYESMKKEEESMDCAELRRILYVAMTRAVNQLYITGHYNGEFLLSNGTPDTIYKLLEPVFSYYSQETNKPYSPFTLEDIEPIERRSLYTFAESDDLPNRMSEKQNLINKIRPHYVEAELCSFDEPVSPYCSPSLLHAPDDDCTGFIPDTADAVPYSEINEIVESTIPHMNEQNESVQQLPRFGYDDFGTIAHSFLEAAVNNTKPKIPPRIRTVLGDMSKKRETVEEICKIMADQFIKSPLGRQAISAKWHKTEYAFRSTAAGRIIKGSIDLLFKNDDTLCTIVDYKTNQTIEPELYYNQIACYREAAAQMLGIKSGTIRCYLYYLRFGQAIDVTTACENISASQAVLKSCYTTGNKIKTDQTQSNSFTKI